ncbi:DUF1905 domain-containing protein [Kutzneria buriramensis]|uniref:Uncharacterized protein DUF1905 n=1 Tax=Kutzneria buriramensis TaxID=1045776 RepID=A0A3E0HFK3_9PSEU|nr:DUF1905 domain-containing protein [Kutzneria buriramensis]REH44570.1 uncharacterized protein DUF1905 [Kutzneria buriramensis]
MELRFSGEVWYWRGPSPFYFVTVPEPQCRDLREVSAALTYGWGCLPVTVTLGDSTWKTSMFPKDGGYIVPVKAKVRRAEDIDEGMVVDLRLAVDAH